MRYFVELAYKGTRYHGWQHQPNGLSVQEVLETAFSTVLRQPTTLVGSGRTDAGVHAEQQFAHLDVAEPLPPAGPLVHALNSLLPADIAIRTIFPVRPDDHARFSAQSRYYQYRISARKQPFLDKLCYVFRPALNVVAMNEAAARLLTHNDFQSFSKVKTNVNHFRCRIDRAEWQTDGDWLVFHIRADRFLWGMVRAIVGTLLEVGQGRLTVDAFAQIMLAHDRRAAKRAAPPEGLFLVEVGYPADVLAERSDAK